MSPKFVGVIALLLALATCQAAKPAHAMNPGFTMSPDACTGVNFGCTQAETMQAMTLFKARYEATCSTYNGTCYQNQMYIEKGTANGGNSYQGRGKSTYPGDTFSTNAVKMWTSGACSPSSLVRRQASPFDCIDPTQRCLDKNDTVKSAAIYTGDQCIDGCSYGMRPSLSGTTSDGTSTLIWGQVGFSGATCTVTSQVNPPPKKPEDCTPLTGTKLQVCAKGDGKICYSAGTGRRICWDPGATGTKTDQNVAQVRKPGQPPVTPPTPPPGETLNDANKPTTTTTTTPNGTTTTNNYTTNNGTNAGDGNQGEAPGEPGKDEGDKGSASGGEGCETPPACSGDNIGCAALVMTWRVRCSPNQNKITGGVECGANGEPILVCAGDQVMCRQTLLDSEQVCRARKSDGDGDGQPDWTEGNDETDGTENAGDEPGENVGKLTQASFGAPMLDESGLSWSRSCPNLGSFNLAYFGTIDLDTQPWMCDFVVLVRGAFFLIGSFLALLIVMGWKQ